MPGGAADKDKGAGEGEMEGDAEAGGATNAASSPVPPTASRVSQKTPTARKTVSAAAIANTRRRSADMSPAYHSPAGRDVGRATDPAPNDRVVSPR
ncbi:hypothetical protein Apa02nite_031640 [Actinoplanes palleronii]|uniref:Uncharacterized protein n=1 Tax=Actinoplanes palleronii TaxID=113570 RepID=A0ABQ4B8T1_9ACTN|nr:hypothetical protein Apa02nite_031640 [Actinoplanes palleronii]